MNMADSANRYDQFQNDAVAAITEDFMETPTGRYLLVVPTGGGKTFVAVRAVNRLFDEGHLDKTQDRVGWVAHRRELLDQASTCFEEYPDYYTGETHRDRIDFMMLGEAREKYEAEGGHRLVVIDEAHHGAALSYQPIFETEEVGVLGLTATPSRHDGKPLGFERESYSIGFPELVELGVVLRPEIVEVKGGSYAQIHELDDDSLSILSDTARHQRIIQALVDGAADYSKVIVYAGTKDLARSLHRALVDSELTELYDSISYVFGDGNSRGLDREDFFKKEKPLRRSIIVNVQVLSEGYDDPKINTVVMAAPTNSKLVYMQAMGRAIRHNKDNPLKRAFVLEVVDELPNIRYRIDNRWLFSDVSDVLEPAVDDIDFSSAVELQKAVDEIYDRYSVAPPKRHQVEYAPRDRVTMLLFKYLTPEGFKSIPLVMRNDNRTQIADIYNFLSQRMERFHSRVPPAAAFAMTRASEIGEFCDPGSQRLIYNALENQAAVIDGSATGMVKDGYPWISFVAFRWRRTESQLPEDWLLFCSDMINRGEILVSLEEGAFEDGFYLVKFPLPLRDSIGRILTKAEFTRVANLVESIEGISETATGTDHRGDLLQTMNQADLPLEWGLYQGVPVIVRESLDYYRELAK